MITLQDELYRDLEAVRQLPIVPTMLDVVCQLTGMGFAAVARVTEDRWLACSVRDLVGFGLAEGEELEIKTTLCNEIRDNRQPIVIDNVAEDPLYRDHHTPRIYGLQSYISMPIIHKDGTFFGTLCAIDSKPALVNNPKVINTFHLFAELLAFHLQSLRTMERSYSLTRDLEHQNELLISANFDLDNFVYTASHDLKSPISNIEGLIDLLSEAVEKDDLDKEEINQIAAMMRSSLKRFSGTIRDLTTVVETDRNTSEEELEDLDLYLAVDALKRDLEEVIRETGARISVVSEDRTLRAFSKKNLKSILQNLVGNAIKYRSPERVPDIWVRMQQVDGKTHLSVQDNGLGIPADKQHSVFTMFKRLHDHVEGSGIGLYIVKRMVEKVQGQIQVKSTVNKGTTFTIIF